MDNGKRYTDKYKKIICKRCLMPGWNISSVSEKTDIPRATIHRWLKDRGIKIPHDNERIDSPIIATAVLDLYQNLSTSEVGKKLGISSSTVKRILEDSGVRIRNQSESGRLRCKNKMIKSVSKEESFRRAMAEEFLI